MIGSRRSRTNAFVEIFMKEAEMGDTDHLAGRRFEYQMATPDYFDTMGVALVEGRAI